MFRRLVRPYLQKLWHFAKRISWNKTRAPKLCCTPAAMCAPSSRLDRDGPGCPGSDSAERQGNGPFELKRDFGDKLSFHGGMDAQWVLPFGTPEDVRQATRKYIKALGPAAVISLPPVHNVQGDVRPENLVAMRDAVEEFGYYPIQS